MWFIYIVLVWLGIGAAFAWMSWGDLPGEKARGALVIVILWPVALIPWERLGWD